jgi:hypothetical protein
MRDVGTREGQARHHTVDIAIAVAFLCSTAAATPPPVTFDSPCECHDNHGEHRWSVKNDPSTPPVDASAIQGVTAFGCV